MTTEFRQALSGRDPQSPEDGNPPALDSTETSLNVVRQVDPALSDYQYRGLLYNRDRAGRQKRRVSPLLQQFYNLPVRTKQLVGLFLSELITILGLVGVGSFLIILAGRAQLVEQAISEIEVLDIQYNIKVNQMGFGFRGQSDNTAIIEAATAHANGQRASASTLRNVRTILKNEVAAHNIEYATLVGRDLRIIAGANADRTGERFDPSGLVGTVLANPRQIKASAIVPWSELEREAPPLPEGFSNQDALIRYTVTPVKNPATGAVVGVLVSGDIANGKTPILEGTLDAFDGGYGAIYQRQPSGEFVLTSSLDLGAHNDMDMVQSGVPLDDTEILREAIEAGDAPVSGRLKVGDQTYTVAAQALRDFNNEPVAVLVRGTSEAGLNKLIWDSLLLQMLIAALAVGADVGLAVLLGKSIVTPVQRLQDTARRFALGDRRSRAQIFASDEIGDLTHTFNELADSITASEAALQEQFRQQAIASERAQIVADLTSSIRRTLDIDEIFRTSVDGVRDVLKSDRVLIYRFNPGFESGYIAAESVGRGWLKAVGQTIYDPLTPEAIERFKSGKISTLENLEEATLSACHCEILRRLEVKANIVAPILDGDKLIGLLCVHQCSGPRKWEQGEIDLVQQITTQVGYAQTQAQILVQQRARADLERQISNTVSNMRESLDYETILRTVVKDVREAINTDRTIVYMFDENWQGSIIAESVGIGWTAALGASVNDPCFADKYAEKYKQGRVFFADNIHRANLSECHMRQLDRFDVKANIVAPILVEGNLMGLLCSHQCSGPREWSELDIDFMQQIAIQLGFALEQARLFKEREEARISAETISEERRIQQEALQMQLIELLSDVEEASYGNLTVRADVTAGEIGTVADFFNSIIESLRQIVTKVKLSALQVNSSLGENEEAIRSLATQAMKQSEETTLTLSSIEEMTRSIQTVAQSAQKAAVVARSASSTVEAGENAMDLTVQNILGLRETVGETAKKVKRLGESSQQISRVVSLINQIALQTNLLAINAGIEAARAGEEGQGFAVVAEEVGELAARSAAATQEIEKIVENIQKETSQVVEAMEQSTSQVVEGTQLVEDAKHSLNKILDVSRQIDSLVRSISDAAESQVETSETVSRLMKNIAAVSKDTSDSSNRVSSALQKTVEIARELQESVETFEVGAEL